MVILIILGYGAVATLEFYLWSERTWQKVVTYLCLLGLVVILSVLLVLDRNLPVPEALGVLLKFIKQLWQGGGRS